MPIVYLAVRSYQIVKIAQIGRATGMPAPLRRRILNNMARQTAIGSAKRSIASGLVTFTAGLIFDPYNTVVQPRIARIANRSDTTARNMMRFEFGPKDYIPMHVDIVGVWSTVGFDLTKKVGRRPAKAIVRVTGKLIGPSGKDLTREQIRDQEFFRG